MNPNQPSLLPAHLSLTSVLVITNFCGPRQLMETVSIIGSTTVGAAKARSMLREVAPAVVLVEEAGEIFESQVRPGVQPMSSRP